MFSFGNKAMKTKQEIKDITKYGDNKASGDINKDLEKNKAGLLKIIVEGGEVVAGSGDDTGLGTVAQKLGLFNVKKTTDDTKKTEEENKIKTKLENNNLSQDPLTIGISKIIKNKIENNSTLDTSPEEVDDLLIKIMKDIEEDEKLIDSIGDDSEKYSYNEEEDIDNLIDLVSNIEQVLISEKKLADQKIIDLKTKLGRAESEKEYLEETIKSYEDAEKNGSILSNTQGLSVLKTRLEDTSQTIDALKTEIQQYKDKQETEDEVVTTEETEDTLPEDDQSKEIKEAPVIKLKIVAGPTYSEADNVCYYRVKAEVTGEPYPSITFSKDDSGGAWGSDTVQINLKDGASYNLKATATNSEGSATDSINLSWGCEEQLMGSITLNGTGKLTGFIDKDYYSIKMTINLDTGNITGNISFSGTQSGDILDPDTGEKTGDKYYCSVRYSSGLSGKMNLETGSIIATSSGYVKVTSEGYFCSQVPDRYLAIKLYGNLNESKNFASGTDHGGDFWSVSR